MRMASTILIKQTKASEQKQTNEQANKQASKQENKRKIPQAGTQNNLRTNAETGNTGWTAAGTEPAGQAS